MDLGFEAAGFKPLICIERDKWSLETLRANRPSWLLFKPGDIEIAAVQLNPKNLGIAPGELSVITAGPPCQPFSKAAQWSVNGRFGISDSRSTSLGYLLALVRTFLPRAIFIENVQGFAVGPFSAWEFIAQELSSINRSSKVNYKIFGPYLVNAADFGVPQKRSRALLVILRDVESFEPPRPTHLQNHVTAWEAIGDLAEIAVPKAGGHWRDLLPAIPEGKNYLWHTPRGGGLPLFGYRTRYWSFLLKLSRFSPSWTLPAHPGPSTGPFHWDNRPLAVEEALRLQTFPVAWKLAGSYRLQMRQVGNATPPLLAEHFARAIGTQVFKAKYESVLTHSIPRKDGVPPPAEVQPVPTKYLGRLAAYSPHPGVGKGPRPTGTLKERLERATEEATHE